MTNHDQRNPMEQTQIEGLESPGASSDTLLDALEDAIYASIALAEAVKTEHPSRHASLVFTHLEDAALRFGVVVAEQEPDDDSA